MTRSTILPFVLAMAQAACGGEAEPEQDAPVTMEAAMKAATEAAGARAEGVTTVSAEDLQNRLPEEVDGLERVDVSRAETGAMGMKVSTSTARYEADGGRRLTITISDVGSLGMAATAAWAMVDYDRTTKDGYDRTTRFEGHKAMESVAREGDSTRAQLNIIVGDRFLVQLEGHGVEIDALRDAARRLNLRDLARAD
jgi:hypothetical protein